MTEACGICGSNNSVPWLRRREWRYRACAECSAVWLDPLPPKGWAKTFFDQAYFKGAGRGGYVDYLADEEHHRVNARARIALARRFGAVPPGVWLDVGCAAGFTLDEARQTGFGVLGAEPSAWARAVARERFALDVFPTLAEAQHGSAGRIDIVSLFQVLEHMREPIAALRAARSCLRPGGTLIVETWDRGSLIARLCGRYWQQITPPSVLWLLDRRSLARMLERTGFRPQAMVRTSKRVSVGWALGVLAEKAPPLAPALRALGRSGLGRLGVSYGLGDLVSIVAVAQG